MSLLIHQPTFLIYIWKKYIINNVGVMTRKSIVILIPGHSLSFYLFVKRVLVTYINFLALSLQVPCTRLTFHTPHKTIFINSFQRTNFVIISNVVVRYLIISYPQLIRFSCHVLDKCLNIFSLGITKAMSVTSWGYVRAALH